MFERLHLFGLLALLVASLCLTECFSQSVQRYQPATPTLSPYLNLLGRQGVLPNYYALVRPLERQQQFNQQSLDFRRQQEITNQALERQFAQPSTINPTGSAGGFFIQSPTSSGFLNTSHFFQQPTVSRDPSSRSTRGAQPVARLGTAYGR